MHRNSYNKMAWFKNTYLNEDEKLNILDVGSFDKKGDFNYRSIFNSSNWKYTGLDIHEGNNVDIVVEDINNWFEIEDESYDVIISGQFFEHLPFFWLVMSQIERALKPGGFVCIIAPSVGGKHGSMEDCYRFYKPSFNALAEYVNLEVLHLASQGNPESWEDTCLVAKKSSYVSVDTNLESRVDNLEDKLDLILNHLKTM